MGATEIGGWPRAALWAPRDLLNKDSVSRTLTQETWDDLGGGVSGGAGHVSCWSLPLDGDVIG